MKLNLTKSERKAFAKILMEIILADENVDANETGYFAQLQIQLGISMDEVESAMELNIFNCLEVLKAMLPKEKSILVEIMSEMIKADDEIDFRELKIFVAVCSYIGIDMPNS